MLAGDALAALRERGEGSVQADVRVDRAARHDATSTTMRSQLRRSTVVPSTAAASACES